MKPDVSVLIPAYNCAATLRRAVDSALNQAGVNVQVVIVDDASTDNTWTVISGLRPGVVEWDKIYVSDDNRLTACRLFENQRIAKALNMAATYATGRYFMRCDSDDWLEPGCLARMVAALDANSDVGFVYGCRRYYGRRSDTYVPRPFNREDFDYHNAAGYAYMFRREFWDDGLGWKPLGTFGGAVIDLEDWQHLQAMLAQGTKGMALPDTLVLHYTFGWAGTWQELQANQAKALVEFKRRWPNVKAVSL